MLHIESELSGSLFSVSCCRYEPFRASTSTASVSPPPLKRRPVVVSYTPPPPLICIQPGVWEEDGDTIYSSEWPPVQKYLAEAKKNKRLPEPPSDVVFTLAALEVLDKPQSVVHWLLWDKTIYASTAQIVNRIALHQPRLIKTSVPWTGDEIYKNIIACYQEKFVYTHVRREWYPTDAHISMTNTRKRALRSADRSGQTVQDYFDLPDADVGSATMTKRRRRVTKESANAPPMKRPRRNVPGAARSSPGALSRDDDEGERSPNALTPTVQRLSPPIDPLSPLYSRNRSISQVSAETLVDGGREGSVETTVLGEMDAKKCIV